MDVAAGVKTGDTGDETAKERGIASYLSD